jgi:hypothetical protein
MYIDCSKTRPGREPSPCKVIDLCKYLSADDALVGGSGKSRTSKKMGLYIYS